jgi:hypothetical protein
VIPRSTLAALSSTASSSPGSASGSASMAVSESMGHGRYSWGCWEYRLDFCTLRLVTMLT